MNTPAKPYTYSYYPGCSMERNAAAYEVSTMAVCDTLGIELEEIEDWNCCGATEYISLNLLASYALIARNLALVTKNNGHKNLVAPCSACYLNLRKTDAYMRESPSLAQKVNTALAAGGLSYKAGTIDVRHLLDVIVQDLGYEAVASKVTRPLSGLRIAPYYGCMIVRPEIKPTFDDPEYPTTLDVLMKALGAEVVDYPMKAHCCGGHMTQISEASAFDMIRRLIKGAVEYHADMIVTLCPMCQLNLDAYQGGMNSYFKTNYRMPVLYFTQALGLAFGYDASKLGIGAELVDARPALAKIGVEDSTEAEIAPRKPKREDKSLPMPKMRDREGTP
ncbi:MAG TPA: CoB--CoM heterodisulfide reductase iron-sulfur subunit B family protein [Anaerolineales bacterium]|nr:CoB--CoM heterodisulfide reductase iron-sulfur subunit B family protein [Anaerolineales bacterium]